MPHPDPSQVSEASEGHSRVDRDETSDWQPTEGHSRVDRDETSDWQPTSRGIPGMPNYDAISMALWQYAEAHGCGMWMVDIRITNSHCKFKHRSSVLFDHPVIAQ